MPTSLTYIILSTRGSLPWRPAADMGTNRRDTSTWPSPGFSRSEGKIRTPPQLRCSSRSKPYLPARGFQGTRTLIQKRKLFPDLPTASPGHFGLPRRTLLRGPELYAVPLPGSGIGTGLPFARRACVSFFCFVSLCYQRARALFFVRLIRVPFLSLSFSFLKEKKKKNKETTQSHNATRNNNKSFSSRHSSIVRRH